MPEHLTALAYILAMATVVFAFARASATAVAVSPADFARRRNLWFAVTVLSFVAGNFWVFVLIAAIVLLITVPAEQNRMALFLALLCAVPAFRAYIPGLGVFEQLFALNFPRLLSLTVLLPAFLVLMARPDRLRFGSIWPDRFLLGFLVVSFGVALYVTTFTNVLRQTVFYAFLDIFLPYYVASRSLKDVKAMRDVLMTFVVAGLLMSVIAMFETVKGWLLYTAMVGNQGGVSWGFDGYMSRAGSVRAAASAGHPIALGFVVALALCISLYTRSLVPSVLMRRIGMAILVGGVFASLSRGPWIGAAAGVLTFIAAGRGASSRVAKYLVIALAAFPVLQSVPGGRYLIELLPFFGGADYSSIEYRQNLIEAAFEVIWASPLFGGVDIYSASNVGDLLVAAEGGGVFVDMVNTYIGTMLATGFVGLFMFAGFLLSAAVMVSRAAKRGPVGEESTLICRALLGAMVCVIVTIFTVSPITVIGVAYWTFAGIAVAAARLRTAPVAASTQISKGPAMRGQVAVEMRVRGGATQ